MSSSDLRNDSESYSQTVGSYAAEATKAESVREILGHISMDRLRNLEDNALYYPLLHCEEDDDQRQQRYDLIDDIWDELITLHGVENIASLQMTRFDCDKLHHLRNAINGCRIDKNSINSFVLRMWEDVMEARSKGKEEPEGYEKPPVLIVPGFTFHETPVHQSPQASSDLSSDQVPSQKLIHRQRTRGLGQNFLKITRNTVWEM